MYRTLLGCALLLTGAIFLSTTTRGHGANYPPAFPGPGDLVPPRAAGPAPSGTPPGDVVGRPNRPATPGSAPPPATGPSRPGQTPATPKSPSTPSTPPQLTAFDWSAWDVWWAYNRDAYLRLKEATWSAQPTTGSDDFFLGQGWSASGPRTRPDGADLWERIAPALLEALKTERNSSIVTSCLIALGQIGEREGAAPLGMRPAIESYLGDPNQTISETAVVALGLLRDPAVVPTLAGLLADDERGRRTLRRANVPSRTRAFAAYALGLVGERTHREDVKRFAIHALAQAWDTDTDGGECKSGSADLGVACALAFGLIRLADETVTTVRSEDLPPSASRGGQVRYLLEKLEDDRLPNRVRAHVPRALGRLVDPTVAIAPRPPLGSTVDPYKAEVGAALVRHADRRADDPREVRYGCVLALGVIGDADEDKVDERIRQALELSSRQGDQIERHLALLALGQVSGRPGRGEGEPTGGAPAVRRLLLRQLDQGKSRSKPWAGLALGVHGYRAAAAGRDLVPAVDAALREALDDCRSPIDVGAYAIALGLRRDPEAEELLGTKLEDFADDAARGHVAMALGLHGGGAAAGRMRELVGDSVYRPLFLRQVSIALALLGDRQVLDQLLGILRTSKSLASQAAVVSAMGWVGDARAVEPLVGMLRDEQNTDRARAFAAVALGNLADRDVLPWTASFTADLDYHALTETLNTGKGTGLLNMR